LDLARLAVRQISLKVSTNLSEVFPVLDRNDQQEAILFALLRTDAPSTGNCKGEFKDLLFAGGWHSQHGELNLALLLEFEIERFEMLTRLGIDHMSVINNGCERNR
jgi:hypothetical protein